MKSLPVEGTVFWLLVSAILIAVSSDPAMILEAASGLVTAVIYVIVAYVCSNLRRWGFIAAIILALFVTVGGIAFPLQGGFVTSVFDAISVGAILIVPQLFLIFFSYRAYREQKTSM